MSQSVIIRPDEDGNLPQIQLSGSNTISHGVVTTTAADTAKQLPSATGNNILIVALPTNTGLAYIGSNATGVSNSSYGAALRAGDSVPFNITNADLLAVATDVSGEGISYVVTN